jgi:hypothetical protein
MAEEKLSAVQQQAIDFVHDGKAAKYGRLGQEVGKMLAEIAVELMDARNEAKHWKAAFETVRTEIKVLAAVAIKQQWGRRLVITKAELQRFEDTELQIGTPEPGVRIYQLCDRSEVSHAVSKILRPN